MRSGTRVGFITFLVVSVLAGAWGYYYLRQNRPPSSDPAGVLPEGVVLYLRTANLRDLNTRLNEQSLVAEALRNIPALDESLKVLVELDSLINGSETLTSLLGNSPFHFALYPESPKHWVITCRIARLDDQNKISSALEVISATAGQGLIAGATGGFRVFSGIVAIAGHRELLDRLGRSGGLTATDRFRRYSGVLNETSPLSVYIDHSEWNAPSTSSFIKITPVAEHGTSSGIMQVSPSDMSFSGYFLPDSSSGVSYLLSARKFLPLDIVQNLPESVTSLTAVTRGGPDNFPGAVNVANGFWDFATEKAMFDARKTFMSSIGDVVCHFRTPAGFSAVEVTDTLHLSELFRTISDSVFSSGPVKVYRLKSDSGATPAIFTGPVSACRYTFIMNGYCYFSGSVDDIAGLALTLSLKKFAEPGALRSYAEKNFSDSVSLLVYGSPATSPPDIAHIPLRSPEAGLPLRHASYSLSRRGESRDDFSYRFHLQHGAPLRKTDLMSPAGLWSLNLDTIAAGRPALFVNHNTREKEIILTDVAGNLYLVNAKGNIIWKKALNGNLTGEIVRVDALANGKFQMLFATGDQLHLIDRKGNYVTGFPVKLPAALTSPIAVLDYDGKRDYRVYFACADKRIYNYSLNGRLAEGFVPVETADTVRLAVQYVRAGGSDYIVGIDQGGKIYCFSRRGAPRASMKNMSVARCSGFVVDAGSSAASTFVYYVDDKAGLLNKISLTDKKEIIPLKTSAQIDDVLFTEIDGSKLPDVVVRSSGSLSAYDLNGNKLFTHGLKEPARLGGFFTDGNTGFLYGKGPRAFVTQTNSGRTVTFDATAVPLFSRLFGDNKTYVIYANGRNVTCKLLDRLYQVNQ